MNIDKELQKMKDYLEDNTKIRPIEITDYSLGGKHLTFYEFCMIDDKMTRLDYSFRIAHFDKPEENYANAEYFMYVSADYKNGGKGYGSAYNSIKDFINDETVKELVGEVEEAEDESEALDGQLSIFGTENEEKDTSTMQFEEIRFDFTDNDPVEELLSYGVDDYYDKSLRGETFGVIAKNIQNVPRFHEYYEKLRTYLKNTLPIGTYDTVDFKDKPTYIEDSTTPEYAYGIKDLIVIKGNRKQSPIYCYNDYKRTFC